jgi:hypothetical protein
MITGAHDLTIRGALEVESRATAHWLRAVQSSPAAARDRPPRERVRTTWLGDSPGWRTPDPLVRRWSVNTRVFDFINQIRVAPVAFGTTKPSKAPRITQKSRNHLAPRRCETQLLEPDAARSAAARAAPSAEVATGFCATGSGAPAFCIAGFTGWSARRSAVPS